MSGTSGGAGSSSLPQALGITSSPTFASLTVTAGIVAATLALGGATIGNSALAITGATGGGGNGNLSTAVVINSGSGSTDENLRLVKNQASKSALTIFDPSATGSTGQWIMMLDNIGSPLAVATTITTTNGSATATVASAAGLAIGNLINSANVPVGTIISNLVGTAVTLSIPATGDGSGTAATFTVPQLASYVTTGGTWVSRVGMVLSGTYTGNGGVGSSITRPTTNASVLDLWSDIGGPTCVSRLSSVNSSYHQLFVDNPGLYVSSIRPNGDLQWGRSTSFTASFATNVMTVTVAPTTGTLAVGQQVSGNGCPDNTFIISLGTGTGGTGTYNLSTTPGTLSARITSSMDAGFGAPAANTFRFGMVDSSVPMGQSIGFQNGSGTNIAGVLTTVNAAIGTGTGTNQGFIFKTGVKTSTGTSAATLTNAFGISAEVGTGTGGAVTIYGGGNSIPQLVFSPNSGASVAFGAANGGSALVYFDNTGTKLSAFSSVDFVLRSDGSLKFSGNTSPLGAASANVSLISAGLLGVGTGSQGSFAGSLKLTDLYTNNATYAIRTNTTLTDGAGAGGGTLTNAPSAGNPTKWISIDDNGTQRKIPTWT